MVPGSLSLKELITPPTDSNSLNGQPSLKNNTQGTKGPGTHEGFKKTAACYTLTFCTLSTKVLELNIYF